MAHRVSKYVSDHERGVWKLGPLNSLNSAKAMLTIGDLLERIGRAGDAHSNEGCENEDCPILALEAFAASVRRGED